MLTIYMVQLALSIAAVWAIVKYVDDTLNFSKGIDIRWLGVLVEFAGIAVQLFLLIGMIPTLVRFVKTNNSIHQIGKL